MGRLLLRQKQSAGEGETAPSITLSPDKVQLIGAHCRGGISRR
jgi:hypothetical protein